MAQTLLTVVFRPVGTSSSSPVQGAASAAEATVVSVAEGRPDHRGEFISLYEATLSPLRRYLASLLGHNTHDAQDIAHDAYLRTFAAMSKDTVGNPKSLLFTAARNLALTYRTRRASRMLPTESGSLEAKVGVTAATNELVDEKELTGILHEAILTLPPGCRQVLILRNVQGLSYQEIADNLGISLSGVEKQLTRALRLLREEMKSRVK